LDRGSVTSSMAVFGSHSVRFPSSPVPDSQITKILWGKLHICMRFNRLDNISNGDLMNENDGMDNKPSQAAPKSGPGILPLIVVAIVVIAAIGGFIAYNEFLKPEPALVTATISIDFGNGTVVSEEIGSDNNTALGLLRTYVGTENVGVTGTEPLLYIDSVNGVSTVNDVPGVFNSTEDHFWIYYVNGVMPMESAALIEIHDGDLVEFNFETSPW